jgi:uncharacterized protein YsxB (DUF464 family)
VITIDIGIDGNGCLSRLSSEGHSIVTGKETSPVCAAVSVILRTAGRCLSLNREIRIDGIAPKEGILRLVVNSIGENATEWLRGITDYIVLGLTDIEKEFPHQICVMVTNAERIDSD